MNLDCIAIVKRNAASYLGQGMFKMLMGTMLVRLGVISMVNAIKVVTSSMDLFMLMGKLSSTIWAQTINAISLLMIRFALHILK